MWMATQSHIWRAAWFGRLASILADKNVTNHFSSCIGAWPNAPDGFASQMNALSSSGLTDMAYW